MEHDYILGTRDEEIARLGVQHRVWRPLMLEAWRRAGITTGSCVIDVGAGPGYATIDLAEIVGPTGEVIAIERSPRFVAVIEEEARRRGLSNVRAHQKDLMSGPPEAPGFDAAWCRWVACFVSSPGRLVADLAAALRPGGVAIFHEYADYQAWRLAPRRPAFEAFVAEVIANWRAAGGEPDIALSLPRLLHEVGFRLRSVTPLVFAVRPSDFVWRWPSTFLYSHLDRLIELGRVGSEWVEKVRVEFTEAERNPDTLMITPLVLELIAERE